MKKRVSRVLNFVAFNLLFFALYLNFIHKDTSNAVPASVHTAAAAAVQGTTIVSNPEQYLKHTSQSSLAADDKKQLIN